MYCIYCAAETPNTALFCHSCGRQFGRVMKTPAITCSSCRADNPNDAVFCWYCSKRLEREKAAVLILPGLLLGGAPSGGAVPGISSQPGHGATNAGHGLAIPGSAKDAGHGLGHSLTDAVHGLGHAATDAGHGPGSGVHGSIASAPSTSVPAQLGVQSSQTLPSSSPLQPAAPSSQVPAQPSQAPVAQPAPHTPPIQNVPPPSHPVQPPIQHMPPSPQQGQTPTEDMEIPPHHVHTPYHPVHLHHTVTKKVLSGGLKLTTQMTRRTLLMALAGGTAAVVAGGTILYVTQAQSTPEKTLRTYIDAIKRGDAQTAYDQLSSHLQSQVSEQQLASVVNGSGGTLSGADYTISNVQESGSTATAMVGISVVGITESASVQFVKENGVWKLDGGTLINIQPSGG